MRSLSRRIAIALTAGVLVVSNGCGSSTEPLAGTDPDVAHFVTEDIPRFWAAFDKITSVTDTTPLRRDYLNVGSDGLRDFTALRWKTSAALTSMVYSRRAYYASIRTNTLQVAQFEPELRRIYRQLDTLLDNAIFPDVYFVIGGMGTGGTTSQHGLLIGAELYTRADNSPTNELSPWQKSVAQRADILPAIVAHELVHYQQNYGRATQTLLEIAIREGSADMIGQLLSGRTINEVARAYGNAHEAALWAEFKTQMHGTDISNWLYNGGSLTEASTRPADLGYYIGARIAESYYASHSDKKQAIREILTIRDFDAFLAASGYEGTGGQ